MTRFKVKLGFRVTENPRNQNMIQYVCIFEHLLMPGTRTAVSTQNAFPY